MTKSIRTLAAVFLAASALSTAAEAGGGVRLQFGGPLGSFTAHPHLSSGPGGTARYANSAQRSYKRHVSKPAYAAARRKAPSIAIAQQQRRAAQKVEVAQAQPRKPKIAIERPVTAKPVYTAKLQDTAVTSDAAPLINVPRTPEVPVTGTQSTPSTVQAPVAEPVTTDTAALQPEVVTPTVSVSPDAEPQTEAAVTTVTPAATALVPAEAATEQAQTESKSEETAKAEPAKSDSMASRICRRFSAVIAGLVEVPCE